MNKIKCERNLSFSLNFLKRTRHWIHTSIINLRIFNYQFKWKLYLFIWYSLYLILIYYIGSWEIGINSPLFFLILKLKFTHIWPFLKNVKEYG